MESGGQPRNTNATKGALYNSALKRALARAGKNVDGGLNKVADKLVEAAINGEQWAVKEVADRMDGKAAQSIGLDASVNGNMTIELITEFIPADETTE